MDNFFDLFVALLPLEAALAVFAVSIFLIVFGITRWSVRISGVQIGTAPMAVSAAIIAGIAAYSSDHLLYQFASSNAHLAPPASPQPHEASRLFAGPGQYPPTSFAAYGIVAFPSRATSEDRNRYVMLCQAYVAVLPHASELTLPDSQQMVTVWPVSSDSIASRLNRAPRKDVCDAAVDNYGLVVATQALRDAAQIKADLGGRGPFLLAWSPSTQKGKADALVLEANLSNVTTSDEAKLRLLSWKSDILEDPDIWKNGWDLERLKITMREWLDEYGPKVLTLFGVK
jgi:hypothetical protein